MATKKTATKAVAKKATPKVVTPPKPKFGEVGYKFPVMAEIVEVNPESDHQYAFTIRLDMHNYEGYESVWGANQKIEFTYDTKKDLIDLITNHNPSAQKDIISDRLKAAKEEVARLTKELAAIK